MSQNEKIKTGPAYVISYILPLLRRPSLFDIWAILSRQRAHVCAPARENFHVHVLESDQTTPSNVPNTAMLTGTARTSVGTKPRQKTRPPDSAYILRAVRHDEPKPIPLPVPVPVPVFVIMPACKRVLRTSKGNVTIKPMIPVAAPARSGAQGRRETVSSRTDSGWSSAGCTGAKRRSVPSYWELWHGF